MSEDVTEVSTAPEDNEVALPTTPHYNEPEDADRYPAAIPSPLPAHTVFKGDPRVDGPYLDDFREAQDDARRQRGHVHQATVDIQNRKAEEGQKLRENLVEAAKLTGVLPSEPDENSVATGSEVDSSDPVLGDSDLEPGGENPDNEENPDREYTGGF